MNLYKISQSVNSSYDTYDSAVVVAESEEEARNMHPSNGNLIDWTIEEDARTADSYYKFREWCSSPAHVVVIYLGKLDNEQIVSRVICSSFNAE